MTRSFFLSTFCCMDRPLEAALETLAPRTGHVEIIADGPHDILADPGVCSSYTCSYSVHAPTSEINIASVNERMRQSSVAVLGDMMAACAGIGARHLVVHPGYAAYEQVRDRSFASLLRSLDELSRLQEELGVCTCVENMGAWECCHFQTPAVLPELQSRGLGFVLDCGHARLNGNLDAFLATGQCCHVHLHDNGGTNDDHDACGSGTINFPSILDQLPGYATLVIETRELAAADHSLVYLSSSKNGARS
ncbi:sugar phosphate isomerase/epimerase family protein [Methanoregula sp.]|uniref:sugar phosphate isomerase/epimerase family protein n=1 Tax=Methanoregula sp. TaxID=2052170 RepID=UPI0026036999|nr:sugar phosphate isomerase/epimerase family protein [Methanoregula sp.]MDD5144201.1 sugar phosphate isomerase/epimerase [Methanoregula sp.]